jgi:hypothetical protein
MLRNAVVFAACALIANVSSAATLVLDVTGKVDNTIGDTSYLGGVGAGDSIHFSLLYDASTPVFQPYGNDSYSVYYGAVVGIQSFTLGTIQGTNLTPSFSYMVVDGVAGHSLNDFETYLNPPTTLNPLATGIHELKFNFWNTGVDGIFPNGDLPTSLDLSAFTFKGGRYIAAANDNEGGGLNFTITSVNISPLAVPEPSTLALFALGVAILPFAGRKTARRRE